MVTKIDYKEAKRIADVLNDEEKGAMRSISVGYDIFYFDHEPETVIINDKLRIELKLVDSFGFTELGKAVFECIVKKEGSIAWLSIHKF